MGPYSVALRWYLDGRDWKIPFSPPFAVRIRRGSRNWHSFLVEDKRGWDLLIDYLTTEEASRFKLNFYHPEYDSMARIEKTPRRGDEILVYEEESKTWMEVGCK